MRKFRSSKERGVYIVLFVFLLFALIGLCALVIGMGLFLNSKNKLQSITNLASLAALEEFTRSNESPCTDNPNETLSGYWLKACKALTKAKKILTDNAIPGFSQPVDGLEFSDVSGKGTLELGLWLREADDSLGCDGATCRCSGDKYPCFKAWSSSPPSNAPVTGIRIKVRNEPDNPLIIPFAKIFGNDEFIIEAEATAAISQTAISFLLDSSQSVARETHRAYDTLVPWTGWSCNPPPDSDPNCFGQPEAYPVGYGTITTVSKHCRCLNDDTTCSKDPVSGEFVCACTPPDPSSPQYDPQCDTAGYWHSFWETRERATEALEPRVHDFAGLFAIRTSQVDGRPFWPTGGGSLGWDPTPESPPDGNLAMTEELAYWVNMPLQRPLDQTCENFSSIVHYRSDYDPPPYGDDTDKIPTSYDGRVYFDRLYDTECGYTGPQPFSRFLGAFNAGLQRLETISSNADRFMMLGFTGITHPLRCRIPVPDGDPNTPDMLTSPGYLTQITNYLNIGTFSRDGTQVSPELHPNFIDHSCFPVLGGGVENSGTNIAQALIVAINRLATDAPDQARKVIILASDGISSCEASPPPLPTPTPNTNPTPAPTPTPPSQISQQCSGGYARFVGSEEELIGGITPDILGQLQANEISVTVLLDGSYANPNVRNILKNPVPQGCPGDDDLECFLTPEEAVHTVGAEGYFDSSSLAFDDNGNPVFNDEELAYQQVSQNKEGALFGGGMRVMSKLAWESGGYMCPIQTQCQGGEAGLAMCPALEAGSTCSSGCYVQDPRNPGGPCILKNSLRTPNQTLKCSPVDLSPAQQAAVCVEKAIGTDPFTLVAQQN